MNFPGGAYPSFSILPAPLASSEVSEILQLPGSTSLVIITSSLFVLYNKNSNDLLKVLGAWKKKNQSGAVLPALGIFP